jgi:hypothetical protein
MLLESIKEITKDGRIIVKDNESLKNGVKDARSLSRAKYEQLRKDGYLEAETDFYGSNKDLVDIRWAVSGKRETIQFTDANLIEEVWHVKDAQQVVENYKGIDIVYSESEGKYWAKIGTKTIEDIDVNRLKSKINGFKDSVAKDADYKGYKIENRNGEYIIIIKGLLYNEPYKTSFSSLAEAKKEIDNYLNRKPGIKNSNSSDSQYTKAEYQLKMLSLTNKLQQAKQLGDSEEAKEIQKEIDELKVLGSGVQDNLNSKMKFGKSSAIEFIKKQYPNAKVEIGNEEILFYQNNELIGQYDISTSTLYYQFKTKDSDIEAKITDLTEKAKQARAQGYAADQYKAEIEKLKAKDKKTKDSPRDNIERQIDKLEDELEKASGAKKAEIQAKIDELEEKLDNIEDSKDILTQDPNK